MTANAGDFRALVAERDLHPGLVILPGEVSADRQRELLRVVLAHIAKRGGARDWMLNRVVEVSADADTVDYELPGAEY